MTTTKQIAYEIAKAGRTKDAIAEYGPERVKAALQFAIEAADMDIYIWQRLEGDGIICAIPDTFRREFKLMKLSAGLANRSDEELALFLASDQFVAASCTLIRTEQARRETARQRRAS
jgi:hypothetical protein